MVCAVESQEVAAFCAETKYVWRNGIAEKFFFLFEKAMIPNSENYFLASKIMNLTQCLLYLDMGLKIQ